MKKFIMIGLAVVALVIGAFLNPINGTDCTESYQLYRETREMTSALDVRQYLQNAGIEYELRNGTLTPANTKFEFTVAEDGTCAVADDELMEAFAQLDAETYAKVVIRGVLQEDGSIKEQRLITTIFKDYVLKDGQYLMFDHTATYVLRGIALFIILAALPGFFTRKPAGKLGKASKQPQPVVPNG